MLAAMLTSAEHFYHRMNSLKSLESLIGQSEDADFDCKEWHSRPDAARSSIAKAACGFTNATGGVIVIGMSASGRGADTADVVHSLKPVPDRKAIESAALDIILKFVEPGIEGIKTKTIPDAKSKPSGFVLIYVPASQGAPARSRADWRFYVRIASGTVPMEFFQVEERFGRRPLPKLSLHLEALQMMEYSGYTRHPLRHLLFGLKNEGRGIAKFPGIRFRRTASLSQDNFGIDGNGGFGIPPRASEPDWIIFRGGVDDVIYPGETRLIGKLVQTAVKKEDRNISPDARGALETIETDFVCEAMEIEHEISAEGTATLSQKLQLTDAQLTVTSRRARLNRR